MKNKVPLGKTLLDAGYIDEFQFKSALGRQRRYGGRLASQIYTLGFVPERVLLVLLARQIGYPAVELRTSVLQVSNAALLPREMAERYSVLPVAVERDKALIVVDNPTDMKVLDELTFVVGKRLVPHVGLQVLIKETIQRLYDAHSIGSSSLVFGEAASPLHTAEEGHLEIVSADTPLDPPQRISTTVRVSGSALQRDAAVQETPDYLMPPREAVFEADAPEITPPPAPAPPRPGEGSGVGPAPGSPLRLREDNHVGPPPGTGVGPGPGTGVGPRPGTGVGPAPAPRQGTGVGPGPRPGAPGGPETSVGPPPRGVPGGPGIPAPPSNAWAPEPPPGGEPPWGQTQQPDGISLSPPQMGTPAPVGHPTVVPDDQWSAPEATRPVAASADAPLVLVADSDGDLVTRIQAVLHQHRMRSTTASDGIAALQALRDQAPDILILEVMLSGAHGFEVCQKLRASRRFAKTPVVLLTSEHRGDGYRRDLQMLFGIEVVLEKPFPLDLLGRRVEDLLASSGRIPARRDPALARAEQASNRAAQLLSEERLDEAIEVLRRALDEDPYSEVLHYQLGTACRRKSLDLYAIEELEKAIALRGDFFPALRALASLYQERGFRRRSFELWERALEYCPEDAMRDKIRQHLVGYFKS